ncbi:DeoR/GlpR family DNA-binding transcription regulator [Lacrimispora sp.]|uniref:DeoR/GlpR family DNA-binding transcription regulator n=1 Tax=Lacrimispora sp. TaxID=2719234 RepID=UPI003990F63F
MNAIARKQYIIQKLQLEGYVDTNLLASELSVSSMTIRRDLNALSDDGLISLQHGGAVLNNGSLFEFNMTMKKADHMNEKMTIAKKCMDYIHEGDSIYLDAGTTVSCLALLLKETRNIIVMTHSLLVMNQLLDCKNLRVIMCPGEYRFDSQAVMGPLTDNFISQFKIDTLFLGTEGIDLKHGLTVPHIIDGTTKRATIKASKKIICMADNSKLDTSYYFSICPLSDINLIVTDHEADPTKLDTYMKANIPIITA